MTTGAELTTFTTNLNGGLAIDQTLLTVLVDNAKTILEAERPWMILRRTDTSKSATTAGTWQTSISLASITDFSRFYGEFAIRLFDGNNRIEYYRQVPWDRRLEYKDVSNTFVYDEYNNAVYLNGTVPFNGTLYINYVASTTEIDLASASAVWSPFPARFLPLLGFYAVGIHKGAVDYDDINARMLPENRSILTSLKRAMESWDDERQQSALVGNDPTDLYAYPRSGAINRDE